MWRFRRMLFALAVFGFACLAAVLTVLSRIPLDQLDEIEELAQTSYLCTSEVAGGCGPDTATAQFSAGEDRVILEFEEIPEVLINAVVAAEDQDFWTHYGADPRGIARAAYQDVFGSGVVQGGSTITQQYVKNAFLTPEKSLDRKVREIVKAIKLEREISKEEILTRYLNRIYFGRGAYGIQAAARTYFDKDVSELTLADSAYLAGLIRAPASGDVANHPEEAERRRRSVLDRMADDGYITLAEAEAASTAPFDVSTSRRREGLGEVRGAEYGTEYFVEAVRQQLIEIEDLGDGQVYTGGLRVYTTLDHDLQRAAYETVTEELDPANGDPSSSIVAVDGTGRVVAMMGGTDFRTSEVNLALGRDGGGSGRQPGSSFKPIVLAEFLEQGYSADSLFEAVSPMTFEGANDGNDWIVRGGGSVDGYRDTVDALRVSSNVVYAQLMLQVGAPQVVDLAARLGVTAQLPSVNALVLGSGEVSVLDMASAYSTIAERGIHLEPVLIQRIENANGEVICWYPVDGRCAEDEIRLGETVLDATVAGQVTYAMQQVVDVGTGRNAQIEGRAAAGKTGTTQDNRDAWFVGFTCDLTAAVWMGYVGAPGEPVQTMDDFRGDEVQGGGLPSQLWSRFMTRATANAPACDTLPTDGLFDGTVLNRNLSTTTLGPCAPVDLAVAPDEEGVDDGASTTTEPCDPCFVPEVDPDAEGAETTTTTSPPPTDVDGNPLPTVIDECGRIVVDEGATTTSSSEPETTTTTATSTTTSSQSTTTTTATTTTQASTTSSESTTTAADTTTTTGGG